MTTTALSDAQLESVLRELGMASSDQLRQIMQEAARQYKIISRAEGRKVASQLIPNETRVQFTGGKPKYLQGQTGLVIEVKDSRAHVKLDNGPQGKFRNGIVVSPFELLKVI